MPVALFLLADCESHDHIKTCQTPGWRTDRNTGYHHTGVKQDGGACGSCALNSFSIVRVCQCVCCYI